MILGKVIRNVWSTQKEASLEGNRFVIISPISRKGTISDATIVALDQLGVGKGDLVLVVQGEPAYKYMNEGPPIDALVVALVELSEGDLLEQDDD